MKVLVPVKRVLDYNVKAAREGRWDGDRPGQRQDVDEPVRRDRGRGSDSPEGQGRDRDRRGVDRRAEEPGNAPHRARDGRRPRDPGRQTDEKIEPLGVAKLLPRRLSRPRSPTLIILGKQAIDDDNNQTGQMLAGLLGVGQATFASKVEARVGQRHRDARSRWRVGDRQALAPRDHHHRPAPQRAALCVAAQHHEGQVEAARSPRRPPITAST